MASPKTLLDRLSLQLQAENRQLAAEAGLQTVHAEVLRYLARCNRYSNTPAAIGLYLHTTKGTVSQSIKVLEREKLVRKSADPDDRRVVRLVLTAKGRRVLDRIESGGAVGAAIDQLDAKRSAEFSATLETLLYRAQRSNDFKSFGVCQSCRFFTPEASGKFRCGVTGEPLSVSDSAKICVEHEDAA